MTPYIFGHLRLGRIDPVTKVTKPVWGRTRVPTCVSKVSSRDRIAPDCAIRHPVWPIAALQRRMRFSARLAGFCRIRCHQRRARRAERASFSAFVSNPDFRGPRLRQIRWWAADKAVRRRKRGHPRDQNRGRGYRGVAALARSGPGAARASLMSIFPQAWIQAFARERGIPFLDGVSMPRTGEPESPAANVTLQGALVSPRSNKRASLSFNGAAFSRTRKRIGSNRRPIPYGALQWGRVLTNAET